MLRGGTRRTNRAPSVRPSRRGSAPPRAHYGLALGRRRRLRRRPNFPTRRSIECSIPNTATDSCQSPIGKVFPCVGQTLGRRVFCLDRRPRLGGIEEGETSVTVRSGAPLHCTGVLASSRPGPCVRKKVTVRPSFRRSRTMSSRWIH